MQQTTEFTFGPLTARVGKLTLGALRRMPEVHAAVDAMQTFAATARVLPSSAQVDQMITIVYAAIDPDQVITRQSFESAVDAMDIIDGFRVMSLAVAHATFGRREAAASGEEASPSSSTSVDSSGSLSLRLDGDSTKSTT